jgi:hypothetical protein
VRHVTYGAVNLKDIGEVARFGRLQINKKEKENE